MTSYELFIDLFKWVILLFGMGAIFWAIIKK